MTSVTIKLPIKILEKARKRGENVSTVATRLVRDYYSKEAEKMSPESRISKKMIASLRQSKKDYKAGQSTLCKTKKESEAFFQKIIEEDDE